MQGVDKAPDAFRTISEVAEDLDLPQHVLRFWETRFPQIKPLKRGGGRRYYRPDDVHLLRGIRRLLYGEGYTIKGVQKILRDQGLRYVASLGRDVPAETEARREGSPARAGSGEPPPLEGPHLYAPPSARARQASRPENDEEDDEDEAGLFAPENAAAHPGDAGSPVEPWEADEDPVFDEPEIRVDPLSRPVPPRPPSRTEPPAASPRYSPSVPASRMERTAERTPEPAPSPVERAPPPRQLFVPPPVEPQTSTASPQRPAPEAAAPEPAAPAPSFPLAYGPPPLPDDSKRKLRAALAELAECRRILDKVR